MTSRASRQRLAIIQEMAMTIDRNAYGRPWKVVSLSERRQAVDIAEAAFNRAQAQMEHIAEERRKQWETT